METSILMADISHVPIETSRPIVIVGDGKLL